MTSTTTADSLVVLLDDLVAAGVSIERQGDRVVHHPAERMTADLLDRIHVHHDVLLDLLHEAEQLQADPDAGTPSGDAMLFNSRPDAVSRDLIASQASQADRAHPHDDDLDDLDRVHQFLEPLRQTDPNRAAALLDAWHERVAICLMDSNLSEQDAADVALGELLDSVCGNPEAVA